MVWTRAEEEKRKTAEDVLDNSDGEQAERGRQPLKRASEVGRRRVIQLI